MVEKKTPLKLKKKANKKYIIEYRYYHSNPWLSKILDIKEGWGKWHTFKAYSTEKSMLTAFNILLKRRNTATGMYGNLQRSYDYRIKK